MTLFQTCPNSLPAPTNSTPPDVLLADALQSNKEKNWLCLQWMGTRQKRLRSKHQSNFPKVKGETWLDYFPVWHLEKILVKQEQMDDVDGITKGVCSYKVYWEWLKTFIMSREGLARVSSGWKRTLNRKKTLMWGCESVFNPHKVTGVIVPSVNDRTATRFHGKTGCRHEQEGGISPKMWWPTKIHN